jgi:hypothetical protein
MFAMAAGFFPLPDRVVSMVVACGIHSSKEDPIKLEGLTNRFLQNFFGGLVGVLVEVYQFVANIEFQLAFVGLFGVSKLLCVVWLNVDVIEKSQLQIGRSLLIDILLSES